MYFQNIPLRSLLFPTYIEMEIFQFNLLFKMEKMHVFLANIKKNSFQKASNNELSKSATLATMKTKPEKAGFLVITSNRNFLSQ